MIKTDVENLNYVTKGVLVREDPDGYQDYINKRKIHEKNSNEINRLEARISGIEQSLNTILRALDSIAKGQVNEKT